MKHLITLFLIFCLPVLVWSQDMKAHFIAVGQADATLLEFSEGVVMIDVGAELSSGKARSREALMAYLKSFFDDRRDLRKTIDVLMLTHNHADHIALINDVSKKYKIKRIITSRYNYKDYLQTAADRERVSLEYVNWDMMDNNMPAGFKVDLSKLVKTGETTPTMTIYSGEVTNLTRHEVNGVQFTKSNFKTPNNHSLVAKIEYGESSFIFTGDLQDKGILYLKAKYQGNLDIFDSDVYQVGHHGARNSTNDDLLDMITPEYAVISAGDPQYFNQGSAWGHGHPRTTVVEDLDDYASMKSLSGSKTKHTYPGSKSDEEMVTINKQIYCTCWEGDIVLTAKSDGSISVRF